MFGWTAPLFGIRRAITIAPRAGRCVSSQRTVPVMCAVAGGGFGGLVGGVDCVGGWAVLAVSSVVWARREVAQQRRNTAIKSRGRMVRISVRASSCDVVVTDSAAG